MAFNSAPRNRPKSGRTRTTSHDRSRQSFEVEGEDGKDEADEERDVLPPSKPTISHRFRHDSSILVLVVKEDTLYAGTQGGELLVYDLQTFVRQHTLVAHDSSVLGLCLSPKGNILLSSAGDRFVNVWDTVNLALMASIYSVYDIGDIFCVSWSPFLETVYFGAQNTSVQWFDLKTYDSEAVASDSHPFLRQDKFFDSPGPGGLRTARRETSHSELKSARLDRCLEVPRSNIQTFAHNGYVYCMLLASGSAAGITYHEVLITGGGDGLIKLWSLDAEHGGRIQEIGQLGDEDGNGDPVLSIALDGTFLYSGRADGIINVWDLETRQLLRSVEAADSDVSALSIGTGMLFASFVDGTVMSFDPRHECIDKWKAHGGRILASCFSNTNTRSALVTGSNDNTIALWNTRNCYGSTTHIERTSQEQLLESLRQFVSYRSVSSDARYKSDCRRCASYLKALMKSLGASTEMLKTKDGYNPIVFGRFTGSESASTRQRILFYGHYDVIPAEDKRRTWKTDPFTLVGSDGYLYGRGATDNKGPIVASIFAVSKLLSRGNLTADVVFLLEGEEESGSRGFEDAVRRNKPFIGPINWILLANSYWLDDEVPCLTYGLRGVLRATVEVTSDEPDLHSGVDGSSLIDEPMKDLVMLISRLTGPHGKVLIPDFYSSNPPMTAREKALYQEASRVLLLRNPDLGTPDQLTTSLMGRWRNPSLTLHGFRASGPSDSTIIPCHAATTLSMRLVPNQDVNKIGASMTSYLEKEFDKLESKNHVTVKIEHTADPWLGDYTNKLFKTLENAVIEAWSDPSNTHATSQIRIPTHPQTKEPQSHSSPTKARRKSSTSASQKSSAPTSSALAAAATPPTASSPASYSPQSSLPAGLRKPLYIREGGSIPAIRFLEKEFGAPAAHLPCGQASDNAHLDNERFRVINLYKAEEVFTKVFERMGT